MGKQINYYMRYNDFQKIARQAVDSGCEILKKEKDKLIRSNGMDIVTSDVNRYYFYLPEAGPLTVAKRNGAECVGGYNSSGNAIIEAGFSIVNHTEKKISRARLFSITGYYDEYGNWVDRPECVRKVYEKLARTVKRLAPYTEITDIIISIHDDDYNKPKEWQHKEYISAELFSLKTKNGYKLGM